MIRTNVRTYIRDQYIRIFEYSNIFVTLCFRDDGGDDVEKMDDISLAIGPTSLFGRLTWLPILISADHLDGHVNEEDEDEDEDEDDHGDLGNWSHLLIWGVGFNGNALPELV